MAKNIVRFAPFVSTRPGTKNGLHLCTEGVARGKSLGGSHYQAGHRGTKRTPTNAVD